MSNSSSKNKHAEDLGDIDNTRGRDEPSGIIWHFLNYIPFLFGMGFMMYSVYLPYTGQEPSGIYYSIGMLVGGLLAFMMVDRNVYYKRLYSVASNLQEDDIKLKNKDHTTYTIHYPEERRPPQNHNNDTSRDSNDTS